MRQIFYLSILIPMLTSCTFNTPKKGEKIGRIVKISEEGLFSTTCEGEMIRGGLIDGSGSMGSSFHFTIENYNLKTIASKFMENQEEIIIYYETPLISSLLRSQELKPHFVIDIQKANERKGKNDPSPH